MNHKISRKSILLEVFWMWHDYWGDVWRSIAEWAKKEDYMFTAYVAMTKTVYHEGLQAAACEKMNTM